MEEFPPPPSMLRPTLLDDEKRWHAHPLELGWVDPESLPKLSYIYACECELWHLKIWPKDGSTPPQNVPFRCRSWRHEGECRLFKGAQDFCRIRDAIAKYDYWLHVTLTHAQPKGIDPTKLFLDGKNKWAKLRKRCETDWAPMKYIQTWEIHRSGIPHIHIAFMSVKMFESAILDPIDNWRMLLQDDAVACGFGEIGWVERLHSRERMAGYLGRLARELTGKGKEYQIPVNAPKNFRRIRASVRLLPPVLKNPDITGTLKFAQMETA
jgi:hypothetical protein